MSTPTISQPIISQGPVSDHSEDILRDAIALAQRINSRLAERSSESSARLVKQPPSVVGEAPKPPVVVGRPD